MTVQDGPFYRIWRYKMVHFIEYDGTRWSIWVTHLSLSNLGSILVICLFQFKFYIISWPKYAFHVICPFEVPQTKLLLHLLFLPCFMYINFIRSCQYFTNTCELSDNKPNKVTFITYTIHHIMNAIWMYNS